MIANLKVIRYIGPVPVYDLGSDYTFIRICDLPENERIPFGKWMSHQTRPLVPGLKDNEQDACYDWDYERWLLTLQGIPVMWD